MWQKELMIVLALCLGCILGCGQGFVEVEYDEVASVQEPNKPMLVVWGPAKISTTPGMKMEVLPKLGIPTILISIALPNGQTAEWEVVSEGYGPPLKDAASAAIRNSGGVFPWRQREMELVTDIVRQHVREFPPEMLPGEFTIALSAEEIKAFRQLGICLEQYFKIRAGKLLISANK